MSILTAENLGVSFGAFDLFKGISLTIPNDGKIGLIGPNGVGKTTLVLLLAGINQPTTGQVHLARGRRIGYLRQEAVEAFADHDNTVYAEMLTVFRGLQAQQARLFELEASMSTGDYDEVLLETYGKLQAAFEHAGGYDFDLRIQQTLDGLGLGKTAWEMPLRHLSGGQKTRALLARLLLEKPDLLILDEPTNHLDIAAVEWLEHALKDWEGAVLVVSHDRYFLDNTVDTIWEMTYSGVTAYTGGYSAYLLQRQERYEFYERVFEEEKARLLKEIDFVQRNWVRASTHARALGLLRRLSRDIAIVQNYGILALRDGRKWSEFGLHSDRPLDVIEAVHAINAIQPEISRPLQLRPRFPAATPSGNLVLRADNVRIGYPGNPLFTIRNLDLRRGECAALIGPNGSGKTTLIKVLLGQVEPLKGKLLPGASLHIGYFAQAHDGLNGGHSVLDELQRHKEQLPGPARSHLAQYLFRGEDVFKPVSALSGGERARLALAILALEGTNFLLLDEPTNHLDIPAREALQEVLEQFPGTILLVSHDRYLIDRLATQVWEIVEGDLRIFHGTYREYLLRGVASATAKPTSLGQSRILLAPKPMARDNSLETRRRQQALERVEEHIRDHEADIRRLSGDLEQAGQKRRFEQAHEISTQIAQAQATLDRLLYEWEQLVS